MPTGLVFGKLSFTTTLEGGFEESVCVAAVVTFGEGGGSEATIRGRLAELSVGFCAPVIEAATKITKQLTIRLAFIRD